MRVMVDTNVLISAFIFGSKQMTALLEKIIEEHTLVICSYVAEEFNIVVTKKSPAYRSISDKLFASLPFEMVYTPEWTSAMPDIRDEKDKPVIAAAIMAAVDVLITGDKDFASIEIESPEILTPSEFRNKYQ